MDKIDKMELTVNIMVAALVVVMIFHIHGYTQAYQEYAENCTCNLMQNIDLGELNTSALNLSNKSGNLSPPEDLGNHTPPSS